MIDYIKMIRTKIGNMPIVAPTASVILLNSKNEILLQHRVDDELWGIPGGFVEPGETVAETAMRELYEETGLKAGKLEVFGIYSGKEIYNRYPNGDETYFVDIVFISKGFKGEILCDEESIEVAFFEISDIPEGITPSNTKILKDLKSFLLSTDNLYPISDCSK